MSESGANAPGPTVYALLVGIDAYLPPVPELFGCKNDVEALAEYLRGRLGARLRLATLTDRAATRQHVIDAFRSQFTAAGPGDVCFFGYSGHGTEEPAPPELEALEARGTLQTLVCADSGRRVKGQLVRGLADKELAVLIAEVAARGARPAVVLDCCHSGNGTRDAAVRVRQWVPSASASDDADERALVAALAQPRPIDEFLPGVLTVHGLDHVALSACESFEVAKETALDGRPRGSFSVAFLDAMKTVGPTTTYRSLLAATRARVERTTAEQHPCLFAIEPGGPADALVLDGTVQTAPVAFHVTRGEHGWEVDAGAIHGLSAPVGGEAFELSCLEPGTQSVAGAVRVTSVSAAKSTVEPEGWTPQDIAYDAVVSSVPLPPASVQFDPSEDPDVLRVVARVQRAIETAGPGEEPSPYVAVAPPAPDGLVLRVAVCVGGYSIAAVDGSSTRVEGSCIRVLRADGTPVTSDVPGLDDAAISAVVARLEHVARWEQLRALGGHPSRLRDAVRLEVLAASPGEAACPPGRAPLDPGTGYELAYRLDAGRWVAPAMFLRLVNTSTQDLFVAVLDLTDRFRCHAALYPTEKIGAGHTVAVWDGQPIDASLPEGREVVPGALVRDWLKVIVSETDFDASAFEMPPLDEPTVARRSASAISSTLERIAAKVMTRDVGARPPAGAASPEWCASTFAVTTRVPG